MITFKRIALAAGLCAVGMTGVQTVSAQTTDGFHTIQVFPVVVDSASFTQRFTFRNRNSSTATIYPTYLPGGGTQTTTFDCPGFTVAAGADRTFQTLREICPALADGSQFGSLYMYEGSTTLNLPFSAFSRVANPQGNGFSVEAFAAKEFTSAVSTVTGIRRMAAGISNPAFQTNCFFGAMPDNAAPVTNANSNVNVVIRNSAGSQIGATTPLVLPPGKLTRLSDIFASVGAPAGDYVDARMTVSRTDSNYAGVMSFCTVQDNTSFGADFRIAKQEVNSTGESPSYVAAQSDYVSRETRATDLTTSGGTRVVQTANSILTSNTHVYYFHHPDYVKCALLVGGVQATISNGLEMRMLGNNGTTVIAGGNNSVGWGFTFLGGDKGDYNNGSDGRYTIEVEDNQDSGGAIASVRPYTIKCESGSGGTLGEIVRYQESVDRF